MFLLCKLLACAVLKLSGMSNSENVSFEQACGNFSIADLLDKAALSEAESTSSGSWEKL